MFFVTAHGEVAFLFRAACAGVPWAGESTAHSRAAAPRVLAVSFGCSQQQRLIGCLACCVAGVWPATGGSEKCDTALSTYSDVHACRQSLRRSGSTG
jgi:hypothetical protein